jgi:RHS repeat-associated protein
VSSAYGFNANGSQTNGAGVFSAASYNPLDQLTSITPTGGNAIGMGYHGIGQAQRVSAGSRTFVNDQLGLQSESGSPATFFTRDSGGVTLGERRSGQSYYFLTDGLGSIVAATDASGNVVRTFKYTPYGAVTDQTGTLYEPIRYASGYADSAASGGEQLVKFGQRYYDPATGRWTQQDPIDNPYDLQGWNQYDYAGDDPINLTDPSGTVPKPRRCTALEHFKNSPRCGPRSSPGWGIGTWLIKESIQCVAGAVTIGSMYPPPYDVPAAAAGCLLGAALPIGSTGPPP